MAVIDIWGKATRRFTFQNVVYCEIKSCNFWGPRIAIHYWGTIDESETLQELFRKREMEHATDTTLLDHEFFAIQIVFITGNTITITCEKIGIESTPLHHA